MPSFLAPVLLQYLQPQGAEDNKDAFRDLASDACGLAYGALCTHAGTDPEAVDSECREGLDELQKYVLQLYSSLTKFMGAISRTLFSIENFTKEAVSRPRLIRKLRYRSDQDQIHRFRRILGRMGSGFATKAGVDLQHQEFMGESRRRVDEEDRSSTQLDSPHKQESSPVVIPRQSLPDATPAPFLGPNHKHRSTFPQIHSSQGNMGNQNILEAPNHVTGTNTGNSTSITIQQSPWYVMFRPFRCDFFNR
jgi:hypothetical protein